MRFVTFSVGLAALALISTIGVPGELAEQAIAATPDPGQSVDVQPVPAKKVTKGAEESAAKVTPKKPVWPTPGKAEVNVPAAGQLTDAGSLPIEVGQVPGAELDKVTVETLAPDTAQALGGVGVATRLVRADGQTAPGKIRAAFSYAGFRDAYGGQFVSRLQVVRLPTCVLQVPRPRSCVVRGTVVPSTNDLKKGKLTAEVEVAPANAAEAAVEPLVLGKDQKADAAKAADRALAAQLAAGSVYLLAGDLTGPDGNWGATDLKPSGTWQAGTSGGDFNYDVPLPEPPSVAGDGPELSLQYDASSVDGQGSWTNNQSSVVGTGWDLSAGFIERRYRRCVVWTYYDDNTAELVWIAEESRVGRALCWESPDDNDGDSSTTDRSQSELVLNAGGRSAQIVKDRTSGAWKTVPDFGWKIEQVTGGADGNPYWKITNQEGQVWRFGYTKDAQLQVPYVGDENGEPCFDRYWNNAIPPTCTGVWRWNLDQKIDRNENVIDYSYSRETNYFCLPSCIDETYKVLPYDRGGYLASVTWGHNTQVAGSTPTARTTFTTSLRDGDDVPTDLYCAQAVGCANDAIAFYVNRRLSSVLTESRNPSSGVWDPVDRLNLSHTWMYQRTDQGLPFDSVMWLDTVQQSGLAASPQITLPPLDFDAVMLAGKMDYISDSDWVDQVSWRMVPRVAAIGNGMGGRIEVTYGQADPCGGGRGRDGTNYLADQVGDCYQVPIDSDPETGYEAWTRYYKQLATKVVERDMVANSPDMVHQYEFIGSPGWKNPVQFAEPNQAPNGSDWRGYSQVRTINGSGSDPSSYTVTTRTFLRGTGATVTDFEGGSVVDKPSLQGSVLQEQIWKMASLSPRTYSEVNSIRYEYTIQNTGNGPGSMDPERVLRTRERSRERVTGGGWRYTDTKTAYNADGLPVKINNYGQDGVTSDNTCTTTSYARNTAGGLWMINYPSVVEKRAGDDCAAGTLLGKIVALYDLGADPTTNTPSDGNVTETRSYVNSTTASVVKSTFDEYGRQLTTTDALNKTTTTTYTPTVGWPTGGVKTTNPLGHTTTTHVSHLIGEPISTVDANGNTTELDYDALGRAVAVWKPGQPRGGGTPSASATYDIPWSGGPTQPNAAMKTAVRQLLSGTGTSAQAITTYSYDDGFGRVREVQSASPAGGRTVAVTAYDSRGLIAGTSETAHNTAAPGSGLLNPTLADLPQWTKTLYDDQERPTAVIAYHLDVELRRTTNAYPGLERTEATPPTGGKIATVVDVFGRAVKVEEWADDATHNDTTYGYDPNGNLTTVTDARGNIRTATFDWLGRRTSLVDPDAGNSSYGYDLAGQLLWSIDGNGQKISNTYDDLGRRTAQWAGEPNTGTKLAGWTFDSVVKGQPASSTRYTGGQAYTQAVTAYDTENRPTATKVTIPASEGALGGEYATTATYDAVGNIREQVLPAAGGLQAERITYSYSDLGLAKGVSSDFGSGFTYVKDTIFTPAGEVSSRLFGANGQIKRSIERDSKTDWLSRVTIQRQADTTNPQTIQDDRYTYDQAGKLTRILDAVAGQSECFTYDGLQRLKTAYTITATCSGQGDGAGVDPYDQAYSYDAVGNIISLTNNGTTANYSYPAPGSAAVRPNAVTSISRPNGTDTYSYDVAGQLTTRTVSGKQSTYEWNQLGQLDKVTSGSEQTSMVYDAAGERLIRRNPDGTATLYLGAVELNLSGGQVAGKRYYTTPDGSTIAMRDASGVTWMPGGRQGSSQLAVNDSTGEVRRERYLPFGQRRGADDLPFTDRGFLGKTEDTSTDLIDLSARYYDPSIGKFISTDPLLDLRKPEWLNPYSYAGNNPVGLSDPGGLAPECGDSQSSACKEFYATHYYNGKKWVKKKKITIFAQGTFITAPTEHDLQKEIDAFLTQHRLCKNPTKGDENACQDLLRVESSPISYKAVEWICQRHPDWCNNVANMDGSRFAAEGVGGLGKATLFSSGKPPHKMTMTIYDDNGNVVSRFTFRSGNMTAEEKKLGFPRSSLATHTENRAMRKPIVLQPGWALVLEGEYAPCPSCKGAMNKKYRDLGGRNAIVYIYRDRVWAASGGSSFARIWRLINKPGASR